MGCFPSKRAVEQIHPAEVPLASTTAKPEESTPGLASSLGRILAPASSRASTPAGARKVSPVAKSEPLLQQAAAAGAPESVLAKPNSLAYEIPIDASMKSPSGSDNVNKATRSADSGIHSQPPFQVSQPLQDPAELKKKLDEKEAQAAERRAAELAKREEALKQAEEHARQVKERRRLAGADEVGMEGGEVKRSARRIDAAQTIAEVEEEGDGQGSSSHA